MAEQYKETTDGRYMVLQSVDETQVEIKRNIYGEPFKDSSGNHILVSTSIQPSDYDSLPSEGHWVEKNKLYAYGDQVVRCRQGHERTIYSPEETPALFSFVPVDEGSGVPDWQVGVEYYVDDHVMYDGVEYNCLQAHTSQSDWTPDVTPSLWEVV